MRILIDTHVFLWYIVADPKLPENFRETIQDPTNDILLSVASVWETVIKHQLGNLTLPLAPADYIPKLREAHGIASLPIEEAAMACLANLPPIHRDPFDRIIIAQAVQHGLKIGRAHV